MGVGGEAVPHAQFLQGTTSIPKRGRHEPGSMSGCRKVGRGGGPAQRAEGEEEKKEGGGSRGKGRKKKLAVEEKDPPLLASSWAGHLQGLSPTAALGCWRSSQGTPPSPRVQLCAAQRTGPRLAPRASPSGALLLQAARARAHIHTLALRACAVGGAAPGRLLPPPRVGSASAGRRAVSEREASQRASERAGESQRERLGSQLQAAPSSAAPARLFQDTAATAATTAPQHRHLGRRPRPPRPSPAAAPRRRQEVVGGDHG